MNYLQRIASGFQAFIEEVRGPILDQEFGVSEESLFKRLEVQPYTPDELVTKKKFDIYEKMYLDDQINMSLTALKLIRLSSGIEIEPASDDAADMEVADFVADVLEDIRNPEKRTKQSFGDVVYSMMGALEIGWSLQEKVYRIVRDGRWKGKIGYSAIKSKNPKYFNLSVDDFDNLESVVATSAPIYNRKLPKDKFLVYSFMKRYENIFGTSRIRALYQYWWVKQVMLRAMGVYMEKYGIPLPVGTYPKKWSTTLQDRMLKALKLLRFEHAVILPDGSTIDFKEVSGKGSEAFLAIIEKSDTQIAKLIMGQTLTSGQGSEGKGSYSLGKVQFSILELYLNYLANDLSDKPLDALITDIVDYNFNGVSKYPRASFKSLGTEDLTANVSTFINAASNGMVTATDEDEQRIREILKFPNTVSQKLRVAKKPNKIVIKTPTPQPPLDPKQLPQGGYRPPTPSAPGLPANFAEKVFTGVKRRAFTKFEEKIDFQEYLDIIEADGVKEMTVDAGKVLRKSVDKLLDEIKRQEVIEKQDYDAVKKLDLKYRGELNAIFKDGLTGVAKSAMKAARRELRAASKLADIQNLTPAEVLSFLNKKAFYVTDIIKEDILKKIKQQIFNGIKNGDSYKTTVDAIESALSDYFKEGMIDDEVFTGARLETIVRTNTAEAFNEGKKSIYTDPDLGDLLVAFQYSAILDDRVRDDHAAMDGVVRAATDPVWDLWTPPNGFNCRCTLVPVTKYEEYEVTAKLPNVKPDKGFE